MLIPWWLTEYVPSTLERLYSFALNFDAIKTKMIDFFVLELWDAIDLGHLNRKFYRNYAQ